jgi:hypothetical protein
MPFFGMPRLLLAVAAIALFAASCDGGDDPDPTAVPTNAAATVTVSPSPAATVTPSATAGAPTARCPVDTEICDFAETLLPVLAAGDAAAFFAVAEPIEATCPSAGFGGPSPALCEGAAAGEVRLGYWDFQAGEGLIVTEAQLRQTLGRWFSSIAGATGSDAWGPGELSIGSIFCGRERSAPSGQCLESTIRAHFTFINASDLDPSLGTGLPGERTTFFVSVHRAADGQLVADGFGTIVPPNAALEAFSVDGVGADGRPLTFEFYPWQP